MAAPQWQVVNFDLHAIGAASGWPVQVEDSSADKIQCKVPAKFFYPTEYQ